MTEVAQGAKNWTSAMASEGWIRIGTVGAAHGLKGGFFCQLPDGRQEPLSYQRLALAPRVDTPAVEPPAVPVGAAGFRVYEVLNSLVSGGRVVVMLGGVTSRSDAEALRGMSIYVERAEQKLERDELLVADFLGTRVEDERGAWIGSIVAVHDFGAQVTLEIARQGQGTNFYFPYLEPFVVSHDTDRRLMVICQAEDFQSGEA